jgi:hypothetical protein
LQVQIIQKSEADIIIHFTFSIMKVFENRTLRRMYGPRKDEMAGGLQKTATGVD